MTEQRERPIKRKEFRDLQAVVNCECYIEEHWKDGTISKSRPTLIERITCSHDHVVRYHYCHLCGVMSGTMEKLRPIPKREYKYVPTEQPRINIA